MKKCSDHGKVKNENNCRKMAFKFGIYIMILFVTLLIGVLPNIIIEREVIHHHIRYATDLKYILMWKNSKKNKKNVINRDVDYFQGQTEFIQQNCSFINCYITYNKNLMKHEDFDAVVFNVHDIILASYENLTMPRSSNQTYIFKSFETAERHIFCKTYFDNFFNWTWSYKLNSDIPHPFFKILNNKKTVMGPKRNMTWNYNDMHDNSPHIMLTNQKTKAVMLYLNNCNLKVKYGHFLKEFIEELYKFNLGVDIYGRCGKNECGINLNKPPCDEIIDQEYFFQLVLEDSVSPDFVTPKVALAMKRYAIPIIVGGSDYSSFLPPGSYINVNRLPMKSLVAILNYLMKDKDKYLSFMEWKKYYNYVLAPMKNVCGLCEKLNEKTERKSYKEFRKWWNSDYEAVCEKLKIKKIFNLKE